MKLFGNEIKYTGKEVAVSFQHMFAMLGATIMVPLIAGMDISMAMVAAGLGTIIFYFVTKGKVPAFLGSSYAFLSAYTMAFTNYSKEEAMARICVGLVLAGLLYVILAVVIKKIGVHKIKKIFPPIVVGPVVMLIGFILIPKMFFNDLILNVISGSASWAEWTTVIVTALTIIIINGFVKPKSFLRIMPVIIGFGVGCLYGVMVGATSSFDGFSGQILVFQNFGEHFAFYGKILHGFDLSTILAIVPVSLVCIMEHLGDISANSTVCHKDFITDPGINRTLMGDGFATMLGGLLGAPANTTYGENTAVLAMTKNYDPKNILLAAAMAVVLGLFTPFAELMSGIPSAVICGASIVLFGMISVSGLRSLIDAKVDMSNTKNSLVVSLVLSVGLGLGAMSLAGDILGTLASPILPTETILGTIKVPVITSEIGNLANYFKIMVGEVEISPLCIATILAIVLNLLVPDFDKKEVISEDTETVATAE